MIRFCFRQHFGFGFDGCVNMDYSDAFKKISDGDEDAANALVADCRPKFMRFLARKGILPPDAEDIVQEVFVAFFVKSRGGATFQKLQNGSLESSNIRSPTIGSCEVDAQPRCQCQH